jgi:hypothetical protein
MARAPNRKAMQKLPEMITPAMAAIAPAITESHSDRRYPSRG